MKRALPILGLVFLFLISCSKIIKQQEIIPTLDVVAETTIPQSPIATATPTLRTQRDVTPKSTATISPTPRNQSTSVLQPPPTLTDHPVIRAITPSVSKICPAEAMVSIDSMELDPYILIVEKYDKELGYNPPSETGALIGFATNPIPQVVPDTLSKDGLRLSSYGPYDGNYIQLTYRNGNRQTGWISSVDGELQSKLYDFETQDTSPHYYWQVSNEYYLEIKYPDDGSNYEIPISIINITSGKVELLPQFPGKTSIESVFIKENTFFMVYSDGESLFPFEKVFLYRHDTQTSIPAFSWLVGKDGVDSSTTRIEYRGNGEFLVRVLQPYGFDLVTNLVMEAILEQKPYGQVMQPIYLPGGEIPPWPGAIKEIYTIDGLIFWRQAATNESAPIYRLDFEALTIDAFCYLTLNPFLALSPDDRFLAATTTNLGTSEKPGLFVSEVAILDLISGRWSILANAEFAITGWIE